MTHLYSWVLQIHPVRTDDAGLYRCRGSNIAGTRLGSEIEITVTPGKVTSRHSTVSANIFVICNIYTT